MPQFDLSNLTIVVPTYGRHDFILRQINYLSKWRVSVEIVDGSNGDLPIEISELINKYPHIHYQHIEASYTERIYLACKHIKTPYAMCLADDDFYLQSGLASAIKELEFNSNAVACMGQSIGFDIFKDQFYYFKYGGNLRNYVVDGLTALTRIIAGIKDYRSATSYAVFRTPIFMKVWDARENISCLEAVEYEHAIRTYLYGALITTPSLYWLRSFEAQPVPSRVDGDRILDFEKWYFNIRFSKEVEVYKSRLTDLLVNKCGVEKSHANLFFDSLVALIIEKSHSSLVENTIIGTIIQIMNNHIIKLPFIRNFRNTFIWRKIRPLARFLGRKSIKNTDISYINDFEELKVVSQFCMPFVAMTYLPSSNDF